MIERDLERIIIFVTAMYGISKEDILSRDRCRRKAYARAMVAILMRELGHSYSQTGVLMGRNHTSVMRMVKLGKKVVDHALRHFMSAEELRRAEAMAKQVIAEQEARREKELKQIEVAIKEVIVAKPILRRLDPGCPVSKAWLMAMARTSRAAREEQPAVWKDEMKRLFPFTAETPTAFYGAA